MKPLEGIKVLDLTVLNGLCTMELADYGAEVIKVEKPGMGDLIRTSEPLKDGISPYHAFLDRGKKSITLSLESVEGKKIFKKLVKHVDVLVENFKVGKMDELGLGYEVLEKINPKLVYATLTGFGTTGPEKDYPANEIIAQAKSGMMDITGFPDGAPTLIGMSIGNQYASLYLASAISIAIFHTKRTGQGQKVETSMWEALFAVTEDKLTSYDIGGENPTRVGNAHPLINPYDILKCKDGHVALGVSTDRQWKSFCSEFGLDDWVTNPKYCDNEARGKYYFGDLRDKLEDYLQNFTKAEVSDKCEKAGVPAAGCNTVTEAMNQEQLKVRDMIVEVNDQRIGPIKMVGKTIKFHQDNENDNVFASAPLLGEHNQEIYKLIGLSKENQISLKEMKII